MPRLDQKLMSLWQWEGGAVPTDGPVGYGATTHASQTGRRNRGARRTESTERFLDFDPILPGGPDDARAARGPAPRSR
jgi:hypothetical protein